MELPESLRFHLLTRLPVNVIWRLVGINRAWNKSLLNEHIWRVRNETEFRFYHSRVPSERLYHLIRSRNRYGKLYFDGVRIGTPQVPLDRVRWHSRDDSNDAVLVLEGSVLYLITKGFLPNGRETQGRSGTSDLITRGSDPDLSDDPNEWDYQNSTNEKDALWVYKFQVLRDDVAEIIGDLLRDKNGGYHVLMAPRYHYQPLSWVVEIKPVMFPEGLPRPDASLRLISYKRETNDEGDRTEYYHYSDGRLFVIGDGDISFQLEGVVEFIGYTGLFFTIDQMGVLRKYYVDDQAHIFESAPIYLRFLNEVIQTLDTRLFPLPYFDDDADNKQLIGLSYPLREYQLLKRAHQDIEFSGPMVKIRIDGEGYLTGYPIITPKLEYSGIISIHYQKQVHPKRWIVIAHSHQPSSYQ